MIEYMTVRNLTVFRDADLRFGRNLNVVVGENGTGKTHLLKAAYSVLAVSWEEGRKPNASSPTKTALQHRLADKLIAVFRPESLGRLVRREIVASPRCAIFVECEPRTMSLGFNFSPNSKKEVVFSLSPSQWVGAPPVYFPTRELLTLYPNFQSIYDGHYLEFEETWRDTCRFLGEPPLRGARAEVIAALLKPLEEAMRGKIVLDNSGRFYLKSANGTIEMPLVAEGLRKFGMLAHLIATGRFLDGGHLFWDEPEANLNPALVSQLAKAIVWLGASGVQVFIATHSLFLLRELELLLAHEGGGIDVRFFGLHASDTGVVVEQGPTVNDIGDIRALDEELRQSDRYMKLGA